MVIEISELDKASQSTRWAGCVGDSLHVGAVVVVLRLCQKYERAQLYRAYSPNAQLADREVCTFQHVVQPRRDTRSVRHGGGDPLNVIEQRAASI